MNWWAFAETLIVAAHGALFLYAWNEWGRLAAFVVLVGYLLGIVSIVLHDLKLLSRSNKEE